MLLSITSSGFTYADSQTTAMCCAHFPRHMTVKWILHTVLHSWPYSSSVTAFVTKTTSNQQLKLEWSLPKHHIQNCDHKRTVCLFTNTYRRYSLTGNFKRVFFFPWPNSFYWVIVSSLLRLHDPTQIPHNRYDSPGRVISPKQTLLPDKTQHS